MEVLTYIWRGIHSRLCWLIGAVPLQEHYEKVENVREETYLGGVITASDAVAPVAAKLVKSQAELRKAQAKARMYDHYAWTIENDRLRALRARGERAGFFG